MMSVCAQCEAIEALHAMTQAAQGQRTDGAPGIASALGTAAAALRRIADDSTCKRHASQPHSLLQRRQQGELAQLDDIRDWLADEAPQGIHRCEPMRDHEKLLEHVSAVLPNVARGVSITRLARDRNDWLLQVCGPMMPSTILGIVACPWCGVRLGIE